ncbi:ATP-binding cassette domain-containing protein [Paramicrobacterium agarici]|uniref:ABC-2 type transport system ATP-binding protein/oleandomycin transport system ATP-binding protein n=1 Tax=Paramicrobacterium agarici TaxID=630514 RepID=A0A2A9DVW0_9MICO|nr:ATP-binding cassette domain-containing protein [Microbacterium agarici]PFG30927.1 ABC-2 type transport system ATP-binding protein/oleandomycin transport system ATP-binding protein [Microbacterium agarici]
MNHSIDVRDLTKRFGDQIVLDGVDLRVSPGTIHAVLGPNGAGKTTLINILTTLIGPDSGSARVAGFDVATQASMVRNQISVTGQYAAVDEVLTARENLRMMSRLLGLSRAEARARTEELLERFALTGSAGKRVRTFSGGMRRRVDLAVSLICSPPILFLDEPTTGLDTRSRRALWDEVEQLRAEGVTVMLTTQYLDEADALADVISVLDKGKVVAAGTPAELKAQVGSDIIEVRGEHGELMHEMHTLGTPRDVVDVLSSQNIDNVGTVTIRRPTLDDVFLSVTGGSDAEPAHVFDREELAS